MRRRQEGALMKVCRRTGERGVAEPGMVSNTGMRTRGMDGHSL